MVKRYKPKQATENRPTESARPPSLSSERSQSDRDTNAELSGFTLLRRGGPSPFPTGSMPKSGLHFHLDMERVALYVFVENPTVEEVHSYRKERAEFGIFVFGPIIFFLARFGGLMWAEAPYSIRRAKLHLRGLPQGYMPGKRFGLKVMLVDSSKNIIEGLRFTTLSPELSKALAREVVTQMRTPLPRSQYDQAISEAYAQHATADSMVEHALLISSDSVAEEAPRPAAAPSESATDTDCQAVGRWPLPDAFEHITLTTGHARVSQRGEVEQDALDFCRDLITQSRACNSAVPIPKFAPYLVQVSVDGHTMLATVCKPVTGMPKPVVTVGVALEAKYGVKLWRQLHDGTRMPIMTKADSAPSRPWIAARLELGIVFARDAIPWLGDFERCLAWAFAYSVAQYPSAQ